MAVYLPSLPSMENFKEAMSMIGGLVLTGGADIHPAYYGEKIMASLSLSPGQRTDFDLNIF
jgi:gamma-glutamyl-gamma-aminobutyrate hydrolase PuuD